jgi:hypothetical protein
MRFASSVYRIQQASGLYRTVQEVGDQPRHALVPCYLLLLLFFLPGGDPGGYFSFGELLAHVALIPQTPEP